MGGFQGHKYVLFFNRKLYLATVRLQAERGLGKSYSALLVCVEGLHSMGYLNDADYEVYKEKYSVGLDVEPLNPKKIKQQETKANRDRQLNRHYEEVLKQWNTLKEKTKRFHLKKAEENKHLKFVREVLKLGSPQETEAQK